MSRQASHAFFGAALVAASLAVSGCVQDNFVTCANGVSCLSPAVCDEQHGTCVDPTQLTACEGKPDLEPCLEDGNCHDGVCIAIGCGNGFTDLDEVCDPSDATMVPATGCSADCRSNQTCGNGTVDSVNREQCDEGDASDHDGCSATCEIERAQWKPMVQLTGGDPARADAGFAYDSDRHVLVVFGGRFWRPSPPGDDANYVIQHDMLEWDGKRQTWSVRDNNFGPSGRFWPAMAYDSTHHVTVMFGGHDAAGIQNDLWQWDGDRWTQLQQSQPPASSSSRPSARSSAVLAYNPDDDSFLLFGGRAGPMPADDVGDTWKLEGTTWTLITDPGPSPRDQASLAYDTTLSQFVFTGGVRNAGAALPGEVWTYGTTWHDEPLLAHNMFGGLLVEDLSRTAMMIIGGTDVAKPSAMWSGDAWTDVGDQGPTNKNGLTDLAGNALQGIVGYYDGQVVAGLGLGPVLPGPAYTNSPTMLALDGPSVATPHWRELVPQSTPGARFAAAICTDLPNQRAFAVGGSVTVGANTTTTDDFYALERGTWNKLAAGPPARISAGIACDTDHGKVIVWSGAQGAGAGDAALSAAEPVWTWDGSQWKSLAPDAGTWPAPRRFQAMAYDSSLQRVLMFGGVAGAVTSMPFVDTWLFDPQATTSTAAWTLVGSAISPPHRIFAAMAYDPINARIVLFGGVNQNSGALFNDLWTWTMAGGWVQYVPTSDHPQPNPRARASITWDPSRERIVLWAGSAGAGALNEVWEWGGAPGAEVWQRIETDDAPSGGARSPVGYDAYSKRLIAIDATDTYSMQWLGPGH